LRAGHRSDAAGARFRTFLHDEVQRNGVGAVDLPVDYRCPWRPAVGRGKQTSRRAFSVHFAERQKLMNSPQAPRKKEEPFGDTALDARR